MRHGSLFSGIGGFDLAAEWMGWENVFHCEWNEFNQKVLKYYWPDAKSYGDITKTDFTFYRGRIDIITGGFPCQPFSTAGKRKGTADDRHIWPEMLRAIREIQPQWIVGENVLGLLNWSRGLVFEQVQANLETEGYFTQAYVLPACSKNAPHKRERVWIVANATSQRHKSHFDELQFRSAKGTISNVNDGRQNSGFDLPDPRFLQFNNGIPEGLDNKTISKIEWFEGSIKAMGNAIVPQVAYEIFKAIEAVQLKIM